MVRQVVIIFIAFFSIIIHVILKLDDLFNQNLIYFLVVILLIMIICDHLVVELLYLLEL